LIAFWIFFVLCGITMAAWSMVVWNLGIVWSIVVGIMTVVALRGAFSYVKRKLVLSERIAEVDDADERTLETNRFIFWQRVLIFGVLLGTYLGAAGTFLGLGPIDALVVLPQLAGSAVGQVAIVGALFVANFLYSLGWGTKVGRNPWHSNTVEWSAPSPPPHGNFEALPVVYRGPYEYGHPQSEGDFIPQTDPNGPLAAPGH